jgi:hypothetical protein
MARLTEEEVDHREARARGKAVRAWTKALAGMRYLDGDGMPDRGF